jgi:hypothetical protein
MWVEMACLNESRRLSMSRSATTAARLGVLGHVKNAFNDHRRHLPRVLDMVVAIAGELYLTLDSSGRDDGRDIKRYFTDLASMVRSCTDDGISLVWMVKEQILPSSL